MHLKFVHGLLFVVISARFVFATHSTGNSNSQCDNQVESTNSEQLKDALDVEIRKMREKEERDIDESILTSKDASTVITTEPKSSNWVKWAKNLVGMGHNDTWNSHAKVPSGSFMWMNNKYTIIGSASLIVKGKTGYRNIVEFIVESSNIEDRAVLTSGRWTKIHLHLRIDNQSHVCQLPGNTNFQMSLSKAGTHTDFMTDNIWTNGFGSFGVERLTVTVDKRVHFCIELNSKWMGPPNVPRPDIIGKNPESHSNNNTATTQYYLFVQHSLKDGHINARLSTSETIIQNIPVYAILEFPFSDKTTLGYCYLHRHNDGTTFYPTLSIKIINFMYDETPIVMLNNSKYCTVKLRVNSVDSETPQDDEL